jgi:uncharacterized damage-inducible protein DinB
MNPETHQLSLLLLPEFEAELPNTRRALERIPEGHNDFKPHDMSKSLLERANHLATGSGLAGVTLSKPGVQLGGPNDPRRIVKETSPSLVLAQFEERANHSSSQLRQTSDFAFGESWQASQQGKVLFSGTRSHANRNIAINHMIYHRAQLGVYLRLLHIPVPSMFGPSADESPFS